MSFTTIHFDASDYCGTDFDARRVKLWATNNAEDETIHDPDGHVYIGSGNGTIAADGQASITVPVPETGWNPITCQTTLHLDYPDRNSRNRNGRETKTFGPFTVPEGNISGLITNVALTSNVASLTTSAAHGLQVGYTVTIAGDSAPFNGTHVITEVTSTVTFNAVIVATDVASRAAAALFTSNDIQLNDLVEEQEVPPVYLTTVTAALDAKVAEAEAAASAAAASAASAQAIVTADLDTATAVLVPDAGTATGAALAATIEAALDGFSSGSLIVVSGGTVDLDNTKPDGYLIGYKVTATTTIEGASFAPGSYTFERDSAVTSGWSYRTLDTGTPIEPDGRRQIATRTGVSTYTMSPVSGNVGKTDRIRHHVPVSGTSPCVSFNNVTGTGAGSNDLTVAAAIEVAGTVHPFTFGGLARATLAPGAAVTSDPIEGLTIPAGYVYTRTYAEIPDTGDVFPVSTGVYLLAPSGEGSSRNTGTDLTASGSAAVTAGSVNGMPPLALSANVAPSTPALAVIGDSLSQGQGDDFQSDPTHSGFAVRGAVAADLAYINYARGGDRAELMNNPTRRGYWFEALDTCTHAICGYGINDLAGSRTLPQLQADNLSLWTYLDGRGLTVRQATCTPYTTSSDAFATTGNQTAVMTTGETRRLDWNAWLRDGAPILSGAAVVTGSSAPGTLRAGDAGHPLDGIVDTAATVETSGKWVAGGTSDGLHPLPASHALMAAVAEDWLVTV